MGSLRSGSGRSGGFVGDVTLRPGCTCRLPLTGCKNTAQWANTHTNTHTKKL